MYTLPMGYWTKEKCIEEALKYDSQYKWKENSNSSYGAAYKNNWVKECIKHMIQYRKPNGYWTFERCLEEALKYTSVIEWKINDVASQSAAYRSNFYNECIKHMKKK
jgi:hypothetical protein